MKFPRGCYGYFHAENHLNPAQNRNYPVDRRGKPSIWPRVHNYETGHVTMTCG